MLCIDQEGGVIINIIIHLGTVEKGQERDYSHTQGVVVGHTKRFLGEVLFKFKSMMICQFLLRAGRQLKTNSGCPMR